MCSSLSEWKETLWPLPSRSRFSAAILIPSPNVADNHQYLNAKTLADAGAACLVEEKELEEGRLTQAVADLLADPQRVYGMEQAVGAFADPKANQHIWEEIQKTISAHKASQKTKNL